jgi:hypothetical protein
VSDATTLIHAIIAEALRHPVWTEWCRLDEETDERLAQLDLQKWLDPRFREARLEAAAAKPDDPRISPVAADTYGGATRREDRIRATLARLAISDWRLAAAAGHWHVTGFDELDEKVIPPPLFWQRETALYVEDVSLNRDEIRLSNGKILTAVRARRPCAPDVPDTEAYQGRRDNFLREHGYAPSREEDRIWGQNQSSPITQRRIAELRRPYSTKPGRRKSARKPARD